MFPHDINLWIYLLNILWEFIYIKKMGVNSIAYDQYN